MFLVDLKKFKPHKGVKHNSVQFVLSRDEWRKFIDFLIAEVWLCLTRKLVSEAKQSQREGAVPCLPKQCNYTLLPPLHCPAMIYPALLFHALLCVALPCRPCHWLITHCTPTPASPLLMSNRVNSVKFIQVVQAVHIQYMWLLKSIVNCIFCFMRTTGIHDGKIAWGGAFEMWDIFWCLPHLFNPS